MKLFHDANVLVKYMIFNAVQENGIESDNDLED
jgi:hypothetical protein